MARAMDSAGSILILLVGMCRFRDLVCRGSGGGGVVGAGVVGEVESGGQ